MDPSALGRYLRESREAKELTLEDAVRALKIRREILESFEQGDFKVMDSVVRIRGMLRNYAHYLGLEEDRVLQYYESANNGTRRRRFGRRDTQELLAPRSITDTPPSLPAVEVRQANSTNIVDALRIIAMILVSLAAVAVIVFVIVDRLDINSPDNEVAIAATLPAGALSETPTNTATITPRATVITDTPNPAAQSGILGVQVMVEITQRSWVRILVDDVEQYSGFLEPGYIANYTGSNTVTIRAANAAALNIEFNGIQQETFGARGQEVELIFSTSGIETIQGDNLVVTPTSDAQIEVTATAESLVFPTEGSPQSAEPTQQALNVTDTPAASGIASPTPLFPVANNDENNESDTANAAETLPDTATPVPSAEVDNANVAPTEPNVTATSTVSPTSASVLPLRQTPANPTPTKTG